jgi:hypothetical protein
MKRTVKDWTVAQLHGERASISFPEYQREKDLWSLGQKRLLIDSILQDIDIPKIYFNETDSGFEVVDGQQRLWAMWEYLEGAYAVESLRFDELPEKKRRDIEAFKLQVVHLEDADDDYLRALFIRLQLGLVLITGEKLHAQTGAMKSLVFDVLAKHPFCQNLGIPARRYARETLCAQICLNSFTLKNLNSFARTRYEDLEGFFMRYKAPKGNDAEFFKERAATIQLTLDLLWEAFGERSKQLRNRSYILSVFLFVEEEIVPKPNSQESGRRFADFILQLWVELKQEAAKGLERRNQDLFELENMLSSAPGEKYQIERRHEKLQKLYREHEA